MILRALGKTDLQVSVLGYGAWGIGGSMWIGADDDESVQALQRAIELGVNFIDTAAGYGAGHSERLVGRVVRDSAETVYVATKMPPKNMQWPARAGVHAADAFPADWVVEQTEASLERLGLDRVDVQQFHVWSDEWVDQGDWRDAIEQLKRDGKIGAFGVSINDHQPGNAVQLVESGHVDTVQVIYNVFDQTAQPNLLPACIERGVGVIARVPFDEGGLTGTVRPGVSFPPGDWRHRYFRGDRPAEVAARVARLEPVLLREARTLPEGALRFCLSHDAVATVIPGMRTPAHARENCAVSDGRKLTPGLLAELKQHQWERNFYG